jgi:type VI secretion system protein ImpL
MFAVFFAILGLIAIWGVYVLGLYGALGSVKLELVAALFMTGLIALAVGGWFFLKKWKARAAARELDKTLNSQADEQERDARPDLQPQIQEMRAEFAKAVGSLKSSRLGRSGADALSALPWYVIIGPPGTGKSTALRNSGLKFPYLGKKGGVRGVGGTRNCDWWLTNEGVILDTAGRYMTEEDDQEEWLSFLDAVARARPRRPINGLIVTISASDLLTLDENGSAALGQQLRERVDEVTGRLHLLVPVYLLVTKCDLLSGFVEMFSNLPKSERGQIWGFTFPVGTTHPDGPGQLVREKVDELTAVLEERALVRVAQERRMEARERILRFPRQLQSIRNDLGEVAQALFSENPYQDTPLLRGVYFTSGTQEGRPIDKVMAAMADAFGVKSAVPASSEPPSDARSYFLGGLFTELIFKDQRLAVRSSRAQQRQKQLRYAYAAGAVALSAVLMLVPFLAFNGMRAQAAELTDRVKAVSEVTYADDRLSRLEALRQWLAAMREEERSTTRALWSFGMNRRQELLDAALPLYGWWVRDLVVKDVVERDEAELAKLPSPGEPPRRKAEPVDEELTYERLKRHMLLSLEPRDPPMTKGKDRFRADLMSLVPAMAADYKAASAVSASPEEIGKNLSLMFELWPAFHPQWKVERRDDLRDRGREALKDMNRTRRLMELQLREWTQGKQDLTLADMVSDVSVFDTEKVVRAAFTKEVWKEKAREALDRPPSDDEAWILGQPPATGEQLQEDLKREYYLQYVREWEQFLGSIELRAVRDPNDVRRRLESLTSEPPPLKDLLERTLSETILVIPTGSRPAVPDEHTVTETFAPLLTVPKEMPGLLAKLIPKKLLQAAGGRPQVTQAMFDSRLKEFLKAVESAGEPAAAAKVAQSMRAEASNLSSLIQAQKKGNLYEATLTQLWIRPIQRMANALDSGTRQELNFKWCSEVYTLHRSELRGRYPFSQRGQDADLSAVIELYNPKGGKLWAFHKESLSTRAVSDGQGYRRIGGEMVTDSLLGYLTAAETFSDAVFPNESAEPSVTFSVTLYPPRLPDVVGVDFFLDGQQARQDTGPKETHTLYWPGKDPKQAGARFVIARRGTSPAKIDCRGCDGPWGLFHLLDQGKVEKSAARTFTMSWPVNMGAQGVATVTADFTWSRAVSPFFGREGSRRQRFLSVFRDLEPPTAIVPGVEGCR